MRFSIVMFVAALVVAAGCETTTAQSKGTRTAHKSRVPAGETVSLAVKDLAAKDVAPATASLITNQICSDASKRRGYEVHCASDTRALMGVNQNSQLMGSASEADENAVAALDAGAASAPGGKVLEGSVGRVGDRHVLQLNLIDAKTGEVAGRATVEGSDDPSTLLDKVPDALDQLL